MEKKRWRAEKDGTFYYIEFDFEVEKDYEDFHIFDNTRYKYGNYFKTQQEAQEYAEYMKKCSLEWHEKRDNNE